MVQNDITGLQLCAFIQRQGSSCAPLLTLFKPVLLYLSLPISITTALGSSLIKVYSVFDRLASVMNAGMNSGKET